MENIEYQITVHGRANYIVRVYRPILTEEERNKRIEAVKDALVQFGREKVKKCQERITSV